MRKVVKSMIILQCRLLRNWTKYKHLARKQWPSLVYARGVEDNNFNVVCSSEEITHASQNTNAAIKSYHSNFNSILNSAKNFFVDCYINWLIHHLTDKILIHYWYRVNTKPLDMSRLQRRRDCCFCYSLCIQYPRYQRIDLLKGKCYLHGLYI